MGSASCVGGQKKEWMGCLPDDLRAFGINAGQGTTVAQDEGEWRKAEEQGAERFIEMGRCRESQGWTPACFCMYPNVGVKAKESVLVLVHSRKLISNKRRQLVSFLFCFVLFCFLSFSLSLNPWPFV